MEVRIQDESRDVFQNASLGGRYRPATSVGSFVSGFGVRGVAEFGFGVEGYGLRAGDLGDTL